MEGEGGVGEVDAEEVCAVEDVEEVVLVGVEDELGFEACLDLKLLYSSCSLMSKKHWSTSCSFSRSTK